MNTHQPTALHPLEITLLRELNNNDFSPEDLVINSLDANQINQAISFLRQHQLIDMVQDKEEITFMATSRAERAFKEGLTERKILHWIANSKDPNVKLATIIKTLNLDQAEVGSACGKLIQENLLVRNKDGSVSGVPTIPAKNYVAMLEDILARGVHSPINMGNLSPPEQTLILAHSKKRGGGALFKRIEHRRCVYRLNNNGTRIQKEIIAAGIDGTEVGALTPEMLRTKSWKGHTFRQYNIDIPPSRVLLGRASPYGKYLRWVKDKLVAMGFTEFDGPLVETEFWNCDALYMPQFHSARDTHDVYYVAEPQYAQSIEEPYLSQVAGVHENGANLNSKGWRYTFDTQFTKRLILRSQGTALSARQLPTAQIPGKYFGIVRCFRYDQVDATHLSDFYQTEGIVLGEEVNMRTLLGLLKLFAEEIAGASEVRYVPGYFPFTEPSIEVHIKHPTLGWFELGGSGIFRPEVTRPLGVEVPVLAWGLGIDRMALMKLRLNDLRELFGVDIEKIRLNN